MNKYIFALFFCFIGYNAVKAQENYLELFSKLDNLLIINNIEPVKKAIDSLQLVKDITKKDLVAFDALQIEIQIQKNMFSEALKLSDKLLQNPQNYSRKIEAYIRVKRALIFEFFYDKQNGLKELDRIEELYKKIKKDIHYGEYLYRKASFFKVVQPVDNSDSIAIELSKQAKFFGDKNNYHHISGWGRMLQISYDKSLTLSENKELLKVAIYNFKKLNSLSSLSGAYFKMAKINENENDLKSSLNYIDSSFYLASKSKDLYLISTSYKKKAYLFKKSSKMDSAFYYLEKFHHSDFDINLKKQEKEIAKINVKNEVEKQKLITKSFNNQLISSNQKNEKLMIILFGILILLTTIIYFNKRLTKKNKRINSQNIQLEKTILKKEVLLKELNHRVKNNLSLIISLIKFQAEEIKDSFYLEKFNHLEKRINTIVIAHEQFIYNEDQNVVYNLNEYLNKISQSLISLSTRKIHYQQTIDNLNTTLDTALPIGILLNELITNSIEHAKSKKELVITLKIEYKNDWILFSYKDSGENFVYNKTSQSIGLFIINSMVEQLEGEMIQKDSSYQIKLKQKK